MAKHRYRSISVDVDIDVSDVLDELTNDDILEEVKERKLEKLVAPPPDPDGLAPYVMDYFELARDALLRGKPEDALALLERGLFPTGAEKTPGGEIKFKAFA